MITLLESGQAPVKLSRHPFADYSLALFWICLEWVAQEFDQFLVEVTVNVSTRAVESVGTYLPGRFPRIFFPTPQKMEKNDR